MTERKDVRMVAAISGSTKPFVITLRTAEVPARSTMANESVAYL